MLAHIARYDEAGNRHYGAAMAIVSAIQIFVTLRLVNFVADKLNKRFGY